ncbi:MULTISPECIES: hypothetical protein [unclassified Mycobacterium]|uniref:hypothetical protein n=1 Tax=unclassified Mycobacterium TaxID=2642494 RepID=UPI0012E78944|nr:MULTISPECIES: hypothetical protein [unclassified Mycobacterium]
MRHGKANASTPELIPATPGRFPAIGPTPRPRAATAQRLARRTIRLLGDDAGRLITHGRRAARRVEFGMQRAGTAVSAGNAGPSLQIDAPVI